MDTNDFPRVVAFNNRGKSDQSQSAPASARNLPSSVVSVRDIASSWLFARMKEVFTAVDDTLFATAEKVHSQEEQDGLFQALRVLRLERNRFTDRFITSVQDGFSSIPTQPEREEAKLEASQQGLSLVQNEDLELQVAIRSIVAAVKRDCASPIAELALRLDTLMPVKVYDENMPLSPAVLGKAFKQAMKPLDMHLRAQLTLLKKYEQLLAAKLGDLYQKCNGVLIERGVLPGLKDPLLQRRQGQRPSPSATPNGQAGQGAVPNHAPNGMPGAPVPEQGAQQFAPAGYPGGVGMPAGGAPQGAGGMSPVPGQYGGSPVGAPSAGMGGMQMPGQTAGSTPAGAGSNGAAAGGYGLMPASPGVIPMATPDLLQHLGDLQALPLQASAGGQLLDVSGLLQQRLVESKQKASLQELDTEVIRMVDMLFSFMLEDRNLAEPIKVQLIRLQLPMLKLAVADKSFFSKGGHPARKLFNALADAAIGWQPGKNYREEPFYQEICEIVERVLEEFDRDEGVFVQLLDSFEQYVSRERRRAKVMERRTVDEAQGSARVEAAKARVAAVYDALTAERKLPKVVHEWLNRVWNSVLFRTCLKDGTESEKWRRNVLTARDLIWSVVAPMPESSFKMQQLLPGLRKRLDEGAQSLALNVRDRQRLMHGLNLLYRERQALGERVESERERRTRERLVQELLREADSVMKIPDIPLEESNSPAVEASPVATEVAEQAAHTAVETAPEVESSESNAPEAISPAPDLDEDEVTDLPKVEELQKVAKFAPLKRSSELAPLGSKDEHWQQTYHLKDSWFMLNAEGKPPVRCRLAAIIKDLDQFMFVNRSGARVAIYSRLELAHALRDELMTPLDHGPLFERALQYVVGSIGESKVPVTVDEAIAGASA